MKPFLLGLLLMADHGRMRSTTYQGMTALITGASIGLGEAFANELAARGAHLVLVARSEDKLNGITKALRVHAGVDITVISADLSSAEGLQHLIAEVKRRNLRIDLLINNAGLGVFENFLDTSLAKQLEEVDLNVRAVVSLTHAFARDMVSAHCGGVINLASTAALAACGCQCLRSVQGVCPVC